MEESSPLALSLANLNQFRRKINLALSCLRVLRGGVLALCTCLLWAWVSPEAWGQQLTIFCVSLVVFLGQSESPLVFGRVSYHAVTHQKFKRILIRAGLKAAIGRGASFHSLRHTFASEFMKSGGRLADLQLILGHQSMTQTEKYLHFAPDYLAGATKRVSFEVPEGQVLPLSRKQKA